MEQVILKEEMSQAQAPPLGTSFMGLSWVGPAIIEYGTDEQKQRFIPDILDGKHCSGAPATPSRAPAATSPRSSARRCATASTTS